MFRLLRYATLSLLRRTRRRSALTILAVATATLVFSAVMVIPYAINRIIDSAQASPRLVITNRASLSYGLPEHYYGKLQRIPGVIAVTRMIWFGGVYDDPRNQFPTMALDADNPDVVWPEYGMQRATVEAFKSSRDAALVGIASMHRFNWHIGQTVALRSQIYQITLTFRIAGVFDQGPDLTAFMFHRDYLDEALHNPGRVDMFWVRCPSFGDAPRVAAAIDESFRNSGAETQSDTEKAFMGSFISRFRPIAQLVEGIGVCAVLAIALAVLNATTMSMRERRGELAILRGLGFVGSQILVGAAAESALIAMVGGVLGIIAASVLLNQVRGFAPALGPLLSFGMPRELMAAGLAVALAIGLLAALLPAVMAVRQSVHQTMRHV